MAKCISCGSESPDGAKFCGGCGGPLPPPAPPDKVHCASCGRESEAAAKFCGGCGSPLAAAPQPQAAPLSAQGERIAVKPRPVRRARARRWLWAAAGVVVVLAGIGVLLDRSGRSGAPLDPLDRDRHVGKKLEFGGGTLYYDPPVKEEQAQVLGQYLVQSQFFTAKPATAQIRRRDENWEFRFVVVEDYEKIAGFVDSIKKFALELSRNVFDEEPVNVQLCDRTMRTIGGIGYPARIAGWAGFLGAKLEYGKAVLYYVAPVTEAEAGKLGQVLQDGGFFGDNEMVVQLRKSGGRYLFRFPLRAGFEVTQDYIAAVRQTAGEISKKALAGAPVVVQLCDDGLWTRETVRDKD